jgi:3-deoxy-D-manno-octulosonate 8-phosphate phosphatase (KDO 8-P phosphatase)|tara:strand:+ start:1338 stop:1880 length:543 start_codon:yes stop_codon:yes gene_type:complete
MDKKLQDSLSKIKLFICDIDGVLTDGSFIKSTSGDELRSFNALDGVGFVTLRLLNLNIKTAWITGRESLTTTQRAEELQIDDVYNGVIRKIDAYNELKKKYGVLDNEVCFIGDDIIDIPILEKVGFAVTVPNAPKYISNYAHYTTLLEGGKGAVREVIDLLIQSRGDFTEQLDKLLSELK